MKLFKKKKYCYDFVFMTYEPNMTRANIYKYFLKLSLFRYI